MSANYTCKIDDKDFKKKMAKIQRDFPTFNKVLMGRLGMRLMAKVKVLTPVLSGLLRRSWFLDEPKITPTQSSIELKNNVVYGSAREYGTSKMAGKFMLRRGMDELNSQAPQILEAEIQHFINAHGGGH